MLVILVQNGVKFMFPFRIPENPRKSQKTLFRNFFWGMSWISFEIHLYHSKFDGDHNWLGSKKNPMLVILVQNEVKFMFPFRIPENRKKRCSGIFFGACSFEIHPSHSKFDGDHESASCFDLISIIEELSVYFWCTSGQFGFSNSLKVKSELCSSHSFYQFKNIFKRKEEVF